MTNKVIYGVKEEKRKIIIEFLSNEEIHVDTVVGLKLNGKGIYFKVSEVSTFNAIELKVTAEEYGHGSFAGRVDIRDFMKNVFVSVITDQDVLDDLKKRSSWL